MFPTSERQKSKQIADKHWQVADPSAIAEVAILLALHAHSSHVASDPSK